MCSNEKQIRLELAKQRCLQCLYSGSRLLPQLCPRRCSERRSPFVSDPILPSPCRFAALPVEATAFPLPLEPGQGLLAGPCCAHRALHELLCPSQPISQPIASQLQLLRNLCKGRSRWLWVPSAVIYLWAALTNSDLR